MATVNKDFKVKNNISIVNTADTATTASHYIVETSSDGVIRPKTLANVRTEIVTTAAVNSAAATTVGTITSGTWQGSVISATYIDSAIARLASPTFTGTVILPTSATGGASIRIPHGTAPTAPTNGDIWTTTAGVYARINGSTVGPFGSASQEVYYQTTAPSSPTTGTIWVDSDEVVSTLNSNDFSLKSGKLSQFAATTSAELAGIISDETGSGALVFATSPTLTTPNIGSATASYLTLSAQDGVNEGGQLTLNGAGSNANWNIDVFSGKLRIFSGTEKFNVGSSQLDSTVPFIFPAATASATSIRIPHGTAPSAPTNGDIWTTTSGMFGRINGTTEQFATQTYVAANTGGLNPFLLGGM